MNSLNTIKWEDGDNIKETVEQLLTKKVQQKLIPSIKVTYDYQLISTRSQRKAAKVNINTSKDRVSLDKYDKTYGTLKKELLISNKKLIALKFEEEKIPIADASIEKIYNEKFDEIADGTTAVSIHNEDEFDEFLRSQLEYADNTDETVPTLGFSNNFLYIFLIFFVYDALHDYKVDRIERGFDIGNFKTKMRVLFDILQNEYNIQSNITEEELTQTLIDDFNHFFDSSGIEPDLNSFSYKLLEKTFQGKKKESEIFYNQAKQFVKTNPSIHYLVSNAPSGLRYDEELNPSFREDSTINNSCFANQGSEIDGSGAGYCGTIKHMLTYGDLFIELGNFDIIMGGNNAYTIRFCCEYFVFEDGLYSSLIIRRKANGKTFYANYVYKIMDKNTQKSDTITVGSQATKNKPDSFIYKYCPDYMGVMINKGGYNSPNKSISTPYPDATLNPFAHDDIIQYLWKFLCDFLQSLLASVDPEELYRNSRFNEKNNRAVIVMHGDQPAEALHAILLYFSKVKNMNKYVHTCLSLTKFLKVSNIGGLLTYLPNITQIKGKRDKKRKRVKVKRETTSSSRNDVTRTNKKRKQSQYSSSSPFASPFASPSPAPPPKKNKGNSKGTSVSIQVNTNNGEAKNKYTNKKTRKSSQSKSLRIQDNTNKKNTTPYFLRSTSKYSGGNGETEVIHANNVSKSVFYPNVQLFNTPNNQYTKTPHFSKMISRALTYDTPNSKENSTSNTGETTDEEKSTSNSGKNITTTDQLNVIDTENNEIIIPNSAELNMSNELYNEEDLKTRCGNIIMMLADNTMIDKFLKFDYEYQRLKDYNSFLIQIYTKNKSIGDDRSIQDYLPPNFEFMKNFLDHSERMFEFLDNNDTKYQELLYYYKILLNNSWENTNTTRKRYRVD